jgi:hypothetical protein
VSPPDVPESARERVRRAAGDRCGYCRSPQHLVLARLEIEHIRPRALGGLDEEENLWLSCGLCNRYKGPSVEGLDSVSLEIVALFNPREQVWSDHFAWSEGGARIVGTTPTGRATVNVLQLNNAIAVEVRRNWVLAGWHPPADG